MPRIRTIKPGFFKSEDVSVLPFRARLTWVGLWTHCDDQGRAKDNARLIKAEVWPLDEVSLRDVEEDLQVLAENGRIVRYEVGGARFLEIVNWHDHQKIPKPTPSRIPAPHLGTFIDQFDGDQSLKEGTAVDPRNAPGASTEQLDSDGQHEPADNPHEGTSPQVSSNSGRTTGGLPESSRKPPGGKGKEREGKGREGTRAHGRETERSDSPQPQSPPPPKCDDHLHHADPPPCGRCADARKARERHDREQASAATQALAIRARDRAAAARAAIDACRTCDQHGQRDGRSCLHDPGLNDRSRRGAAAARAAIRR